MATSGACSHFKNGGAHNIQDGELSHTAESVIDRLREQNVQRGRSQMTSRSKKKRGGGLKWPKIALRNL